MNWTKYQETGLRDIVDRGVKERDCARLQRAFDAADGSSDTFRDRYGEGNGDLMGYIDWQMSKLGC